MKGPSIAFVAAMVLACGSVDADENTYGTSLTVHTIGSPGFTSRNSDVVYVTLAGIDRYVAFGDQPGKQVEASPMLPNGAQVERIELRACDFSTQGEVR